MVLFFALHYTLPSLSHLAPASFSDFRNHLQIVVDDAHCHVVVEVEIQDIAVFLGELPKKLSSFIRLSCSFTMVLTGTISQSSSLTFGGAIA